MLIQICTNKDTRACGV